MRDAGVHIQYDICQLSTSCLFALWLSTGETASNIKRRKGPKTSFYHLKPYHPHPIYFNFPAYFRSVAIFQ